MLTRLNFAWTPQEEATLKALAEQGMCLRSIAFRLKRSESSIKKRARDLGINVKVTPRTPFRFG
jgi:DNA-binding NarL/FixJ family response regulator